MTYYVYTNDSPDFLPKLEFFRYKLGADILIKCNSHRYENRDNITWEFQRCEANYKGIQCGPRNMYSLDGRENEWKRLDFGKRARLEIRNASEENRGLYRCINNDLIIKICSIDIFVPVKYARPPPEVVSLLPSSNTTVAPNTHLVIQCKVVSVIPPEIRWFKECSGRKCEVLENGHCYCHIPFSDSVYPASNNIYLSKLNIYNARNIHSGRYSCLVISMYGRDYKNVTINVQDLKKEEGRKSFSLLFAIPLCFVLVPVIIWLCFNRRNRRKNCHNLNEHQKQLIKPVVEVDIVVDVDDVV